MKKILLSILFVPLILITSGQDSYIMYETMYIKPKYGQIKEFSEALAAHIKQFHADGPYSVSIHQVLNGSRAGQLVWMMGPLTFSDLDTRPIQPPHTDDWNKLMPYIDEVTEVEFWRMDPDLSYTPAGWNYTPKIHIRVWELKHGKSDEFLEAMKKIVDVFRSGAYDYSWHVYWNYFETGNGRDIAGVFGFDKWAFYDEDPVFFRDFEERYGEGSWEKTFEIMTEATVGMTEELRELKPALGGPAD
jgi:hypothetical protein